MIVTIEYGQLLSTEDLGSKIEEAFGFTGLGILLVRNIPQYCENRKKLLPLARQFALLPNEIKEKYVHEKSYYNFGWSHGKENLMGSPGND